MNIYWKNEHLLEKAGDVFSVSAGSLNGGGRAKALIELFVKKAKIFADEPSLGERTEVTIDLKKVDVPYEVDERRPLTLTKLNGVATLVLRPDTEKAEGLLFKICPHDRVPLTISDIFDTEINVYNTSVPRAFHQQVEMAEAS
ncbi:MAG: hypothetical protein V4436_00390 [Patescibacteria group bacterium]